MSARERPEHQRLRGFSTKTKVQPIANPLDLAMKRGLPSNKDAERFVLGSILLDGSRFSEAAPLEPEDFSSERHQRIFECMRGP